MWIKDIISLCLTKEDHSPLERLGDFLLLYQITKNVNPMIIKEIFAGIVPPSYKANDDEQAALLRSSAPEM